MSKYRIEKMNIRLHLDLLYQCVVNLNIRSHLDLLYQYVVNLNIRSHLDLLYDTMHQCIMNLNIWCQYIVNMNIRSRINLLFDTTHQYVMNISNDMLIFFGFSLLLIFCSLYWSKYKIKKDEYALIPIQKSSQKPHLKPILLTNNMKKAQEITTLFGFPFDVMGYDEMMNSLDLVSNISEEKFRPVLKEEIEVIEVMIGDKKFDIGYHITEEMLDQMIGQTISICLRVYVAEPGSEIRVFHNKTNGRVVPKSGAINPLCFGWDYMFIPNGFSNTVAEMGQHRNMFNFRSQVYEQISDYLSGRPSTSIYEGHITLSHSNLQMPFEEQKTKFMDLCSKLGVKAILIELQSGIPENGNFQFQTSQWFNRPFCEARKSMTEISKEFMSNGWIVQRQKIEATPCLRTGSINCPIEDTDVKNYPLTNYFEFHAKISMTDENEPIIKQLCNEHQTHLSRNAFKKFEQYDHRFLTMRLYGIGQKNAFANFDSLLSDLKKMNIEVVNTQREYAVWDTNVRLDAGWIN